MGEVLTLIFLLSCVGAGWEWKSGDCPSFHFEFCIESVCSRANRRYRQFSVRTARTSCLKHSNACGGTGAASDPQLPVSICPRPVPKWVSTPCSLTDASVHTAYFICATTLCASNASKPSTKFSVTANGWLERHGLERKVEDWVSWRRKWWRCCVCAL